MKSNQIFRFIAEFNGMAVGEEKFQEFKEAVEAYIIAQSQLDNVKKLREEDEDVEEKDDEADDDDMKDFDN